MSFIGQVLSSYCSCTLECFSSCWGHCVILHDKSIDSLRQQVYSIPCNCKVKLFSISLLAQAEPHLCGLLGRYLTGLFLAFRLSSLVFRHEIVEHRKSVSILMLLESLELPSIPATQGTSKHTQAGEVRFGSFFTSCSSEVSSLVAQLFAIDWKRSF